MRLRPRFLAYCRAAPILNPLEKLLTIAKATAEPRKHPCGGDRLLEKPFVMPVDCTKRRETNHARLISSATPHRNLSCPFTKVQHQVKAMTGMLPQELQSHHRDPRPMSLQIMKPLVPVPGVVDAMVWEVSRVAVDAPRSTTASPRQPSLRWPRQTHLQRLLGLTVEHR